MEVISHAQGKTQLREGLHYMHKEEEDFTLHIHSRENNLSHERGKGGKSN